MRLQHGVLTTEAYAMRPVGSFHLLLVLLNSENTHPADNHRAAEWCLLLSQRTRVQTGKHWLAKNGDLRVLTGYIQNKWQSVHYKLQQKHTFVEQSIT